MMTPQMLTPELSSNSPRARARLCAPSTALCLLGLLATATACSGTIDENQDVPRARPVTIETNNGSNAAGAPSPASTSTGTANGANESSASEREDGDILGVNGSGSSSSSRRRGGVVRERNPELDEDAGLVADAGSIEDAGNVDAGVLEADAGLAGDAALP